MQKADKHTDSTHACTHTRTHTQMDVIVMVRYVWEKRHTYSLALKIRRYTFPAFYCTSIQLLMLCPRHTHTHTHTCTRTHAHSPEAQKHTLPTFLFFNTPPVFQFLTLFSVSGLAVSTPPRSDPFTARPLVLTTTRPRSQRRLCVDTRPSVSCVILYI